MPFSGGIGVSEWIGNYSLKRFVIFPDSGKKQKALSYMKPLFCTEPKMVKYPPKINKIMVL